MNIRTFIYYLAAIAIVSFVCVFNIFTQYWSLNHKESFIFSVTSLDNEVYVPPTAWLSPEEFRISVRSVMQSKYFAHDDKDISIILIKGLKDKNGESEACGVQRLSFTKFSHNDINKILNTAIAQKWNNCPQ